MTDQARLSWALALSLLLHITVLALLPLLRHLTLPVAAPSTVEVDLSELPLPAPRPAPKPAPQAAPQPAPQPQPAPPIVLPERQIVSPSDKGEAKPPKETRLLSDRDNTVPQEMVHRGQAEPGSPEAAAKSAKEAKPVEHAAAEKSSARRRPAASRQAKESAANAPERLASLPKLNQLLPPVGDIISEGFSKPAASKPREQVASAPRARNLFAGSGGAFSSRPGISDFLPSIHEGDVTLLNTKAELFAPFVRRVAVRVFQHLEIALKQAARGRPGGSGREFAEVEAVMNRKGQMIDARLLQKESSTNLAAYRELLGATQPDIFFDANPPPGAEANDGNIHFILVVDLQVQSATDPRSGAPATGFYGVAGVGLDSAPGEK
jgi:colicin import membrane protein